jgi:ribosomal protein L7/L12
MEVLLGLATLIIIVAIIVKYNKDSENKTTEKQSISSSVNSYKNKYQNVQSNPYDPSFALDEALLWELQHNGKIRAIRILRENTGLSLADAKTYVEHLELRIPRCKKESEASKPEDVSAVDGMDGHAFENYCAQLLRKVGFAEVSVTPGSGDQGVDVLATKDGIKYAVQCKNYATPLGNTPIQEVNAGKVFYNCHVAVVMTNSTFTPKAKELAQATGVLLWGRDKLQEMIVASNRTKQEAPKNQNVVSTAQTFSAQEPVPQKPVVQAPVAPLSAVASHFMNGEGVSITEEIDGVQINVHVGSASAVNLTLSSFGIDKDDDMPDELTLMFDVEAKNAHGIPEDVTIVCNAFAGDHKLATEHEYLYKNSFDWRDSLEVYFNKKNLMEKTTRIDIYCKRRAL